MTVLRGLASFQRLPEDGEHSRGEARKEERLLREVRSKPVNREGEGPGEEYVKCLAPNVIPVEQPKVQVGASGSPLTPAPLICGIHPIHSLTA